MIEPKRLLEGDATEFERQLLSSVVDESPSRAEQLRMVRALCLVGPVLWSARARAVWETARGGVQQTASVVATTKGAAVVLALGLTTAGVYFQQNASNGSVVVPTELPAVSLQRKAVSPGVAPVAAPVESTLGQEVALLDEARSALRSHRLAEAEGVLVKYRMQFPRGVLRQEASVLEGRVLKAQD